MKKIVLISVISVFVGVMQAQTFNWVTQRISLNNNLKGMTVASDGTAVIFGYGRTAKKSSDLGVSWQDIDIFSSTLNFVDLSIQKNTGYIVSNRSRAVDNPSGGEADVYFDGIILKTLDGGLSWTVLDLSSFGEGDVTALNPNLPGCKDIDFQSVECINDTVALVGVRWNDTSTGIQVTHSAAFKTIDGGVSWKALSGDLGGNVVTSFCLIGDEFFIGARKAFFKGSIGSDILIDLYPVLDIDGDDAMFIFDVDVYNGTELLVTTSGDGIYSSSDSGLSFTPIVNLSGANDFFKYNDQVMIALGSASKSKASIDGGASWNACYPGTSCWDIAGIFNDSLVALSQNVIYKLAVTDLISGAYNWRMQTIHDGGNLQKMHVIDNSSALIIGNGEGVKWTSDKGISWENKSMPSYISKKSQPFDFNSLSQGEGAAYASSRRLKYANFDGSIQDSYYSGLILRSTDNWNTWSILDNTQIGAASPADPSVNPSMLGCFAMDHYTVECVDALNAYVYVNWYDTTMTVKKTHSRVFKTTDGGAGWFPVTDDFGVSFVTAMEFTGDTGYIAGNKILLKTVDGGETFTDLYPILTVGTDSNLYLQDVELLGSHEIIIPTSTDGVFVSKDAGLTFSRLEGVDGGNDVIKLDNNSLMIGGSSKKTHFTNDNGITWESCSPGASIWVVGEVYNDSLYVLCKSVVYKIALTDLDLDTQLNQAVPSKSHQIQVRYTSQGVVLFSKDHMIEKCYVISIGGSVVAVSSPKDMHCAFYNSQFSSGVYLIVAEVKGQVETHKVVFK